MFDNFSSNFAIFLFAFAIGLLVFYYLRTSESEDIEYQELDEETLKEINEKQNAAMQERIKVLCKNVDAIWNSLAIDKWMQVDGTTEADIKTEFIAFSMDNMAAESLYAKRALRVICQLNWTTQKMYVRVEQQLKTGNIQVEGKAKIKAGLISLNQADHITDGYFKKVLKIINSPEFQEEEPEEPEEEQE